MTKVDDGGPVAQGADAFPQIDGAQLKSAGAVLQHFPPSTAPTEREALLGARGADPVPGITGPSSRLGTQADMAEARKWKDECRLSLDEQIGVIREVMGRSAKPGAVRSFRYFTDAMLNLAAAKLSPLPSVQPKPPAMDAARARWRKLAGQCAGDERKTAALPR
jgi:hypothetical protein